MKPTKARIELMQAISDGAVGQRYSIGVGYESTWDKGPGSAIRSQRRYHRVTAAVRALHQEDLVTMGPRRIGDSTPRLWELTPAGEAWLKANGGTT